MSNIQTDESLDDLPQVMDFMWRQWRKDIHTALPGVIHRYSPRTRRADVQPQIRTMLTDFSTASRPIVTDVPVVTPFGGGFGMYLPLKPGDNVLMVFAMRDLSEFKQTYKESTPLAGILELGNAIAIPGFGPLNMTPVDQNAVCLQAEGGNPYFEMATNEVVTRMGNSRIRMTSDEILMEVGEATIRITADDILVNAPHIGLNDDE